MPKTILALLGARHIDRMDRIDRMERTHERTPSGPPLASHEMHEQRHPDGDEPAGKPSSK
jgi:hypothetical protein